MAILTGVSAATIIGTTAAVGSAAYGIASAEKAKKTARGQEKNAKAAATQAIADQKAASAALAAMEAESMVPGFGDSNYIPGYKGSSSSFSPQGSSMFSLGNPTIYSPDGIAMGSMFPDQSSNLTRIDGGTQNKPVFERFDDVGDRASRTVIQPLGDPMDRGYQEAVRAGYDPTTGVSMRDEVKKVINFENGKVADVKVTSKNKQQALLNELLKRRFAEVTQGLPKNNQGKPIFPDPNTTEGQRFYASLPKSIANMASDPKMAQMYRGSNIVNPYANIRDLSGIAEDVSDLVRDRSDLLSDRTDLIQDRTNLLADRTGLFESATDLGEDLSAGQVNLSTGLEDLSGRITDLRPGAQDFSGLASDTSVLASNAFANLQVATQAADLQAQQSDQALANTLSTIRATGAGAGGATAIAQAALQSKLNISATIEQQEARNVQSRAQGQQQIEQIRMSESKRLQDIAFSERIRLEGLRQSEGLRIDDTRLDEGRRIQGIGLEEGRRMQGVELDEGRRLQQLSISERMREQGLTLDESLRLQQAQFDTARERDRFAFDEAGRLEEARFNEAGRLQSAQVSEALRLQQIKLAEQQRLQNADAMAREYQFATAERREQNRLNRAAGLETQAMQTSADLQANQMAAAANTAAAKSASTAAIVQGGLGLASAGLSAFQAKPKGVQSKVDPNIRYDVSKITIPSGENINAFQYTNPNPGVPS